MRVKILRVRLTDVGAAETYSAGVRGPPAATFPDSISAEIRYGGEGYTEQMFPGGAGGAHQTHSVTFRRGEKTAEFCLDSAEAVLSKEELDLRFEVVFDSEDGRSTCCESE